MKRNIYVILTLLCILSVILIQNIFFVVPSPKKEFKFDIHKEKLITSPYQSLFAIFCLVWLIIFLFGIINLIIFSIRKLRKKPLALIQKTQKKFPLSETTAAKLLFLISLLVLFVYLLPLIMHILKIKYLTVNFALLLNMVLQAGAIIIILKYIKAKFLGFYLNKKQFVFLLKIYSSLLILILVSSIINNFVVKKIGIELLPGPIIELLFHLRGRFSLFILVMQIILIGPIAEELFFRGFIYKLCRSRYTFITSTILTSLFFSLIHRIPQNILPLFLISACLCYIYEKTQNILPAIIFHLIHNTLVFSVLLALKILT